MWKRYKCIYLSGKCQSEKAKYYMIPSICHFREGKIKNEESQKLGKGEVSNTWSTEDFQDSENTLYDIIFMDTCHYIVQTH